MTCGEAKPYVVCVDGGIDSTGAVDASPVIQDVFDDITTSGHRAAEIHLPPGLYRINNRVEFEGYSSLQSLVINGHGIQGIDFQCYNDGGFCFDLVNRKQTLYISGVKFTAMAPAAGTAIEVKQPVGGSQHRRNLILRDIEIGTGDNSDHYFHDGVKLTGLHRPLFENVMITGPYGPNNQNAFPIVTGIKMTDCYSPLIKGCCVWSADTGILHMGSAGGNPEGITIRDTKCVETNTGIRIDSADFEPECLINGCHVNSRIRGIVLNRRTKAVLSENLMYNAYGDNNFYQDILILNGRDTIINNNIFFNPKIDDHPNRSAIRVNKSRRTVISANHFTNEGTAVSVTDSLRTERYNNFYFGPDVDYVEN